jgi:predicted Zn-dependent peptidase
METNVSSYQLSNGIRLVNMWDNSPVAYCGFVVNAGTRDENPDEPGMAHFVEHMLFKGTEKRKSWHIINRLDSVGGELNAYTTKEETYVYATVLSSDFEKAMELCSDVLFHSVFPNNEISKEVEVIIDEINSYKDSPAELIYDDFENFLFEGSSIGRNILGNSKSLRRYSSDDAKAFVNRNYCTDQILFFSLGNIAFKKIVKWANRCFGEISERSKLEKRLKPSMSLPISQLIKKRVNQSHTMIGGFAYDLYSDNRLPLYLLNNVLGGPGMNSKLNMSLRERAGLVYSVESSLTSYSDCGLISIYFGADEKNRERCEELIFNELKSIREKAFSSLQLNRSVKQLMGQLSIGQENKESLVLSLAKSFLYFNRFESLSVVENRLNTITPSELLDIANNIFKETNLFTLTYSNR